MYAFVFNPSSSFSKRMPSAENTFEETLSPGLFLLPLRFLWTVFQFYFVFDSGLPDFSFRDVFSLDDTGCRPLGSKCGSILAGCVLVNLILVA